MASQLSLPDLNELEARIERGLETFIDVGMALLEIRDRQLYREQGYRFFGDYCKERWGWDRTYVHRHIEAAQVSKTLPIGNKPRKEAQARELAPLVKEDPDAARAVWSQVNEEHGDRVPTLTVLRPGAR